MQHGAELPGGRAWRLHLKFPTDARSGHAIKRVGTAFLRGCLPDDVVVNENLVAGRCAIVYVSCQSIKNDTTWGKDDENIGGFR